MTQFAQVRGTVNYRIGDGPLMRVPRGRIKVEIAALDVTLSWGDDEDRQSAAIPRADFARYVAARAIELH